MTRSRVLPFLLTCLLAIPCVSLPAQTGVLATLPNGREIHPAGNWIALAPYPFALAVRPDGAQIAVPSIGFPFALNVVDKPDTREPHVTKMPGGEDNDPAIETHAGLAYSNDGTLLYVATGDSGKIRAYRTADWTPAGEVPLDGELGDKKYEGSFAATLVVSKDGKIIYALDQGNWRVVLIDASKMERISEIETGAYPFGIALSPDGERLYLTNSGLFEYKTIPGADGNDPIHSGLHFPPFAYPSQAARNGATVEGKKIQGLGSENSERGSSLWTYSVQDAIHPRITAKLRLGTTISEIRGKTVGGAAPTGVAVTDEAVYIALSHEDAVVKVSTDGSRIQATAALSPFHGPRFENREKRALRGVMPSGLTVHDGRLYIAESGIDAVGVVDADSMRVLGHIPAGWNPSAVAFSPDGSMLYVVNTKGKGAGPNAGKLHDPKTPTYVGSLEMGSLSAIRIADLPADDSLTAAVVANNSAAILKQGPMPRLKHCFLVIRENRTYDEVLGDVAGANGDPSLARYGIDGWAAEEKSATHLKVTPDLHALVARYAMSDNFYVDSDVSADGHRWVMGINPTPFFNTAWSSGYGGRRKEFAGAEQPGRRAMFGGADAPMPEDEPQFGSLWEHITASRLGVLNYGEGLELEGNAEIPGTQPEGQRLFLNSPLLKPIFESTDRRYPTFNLGIPDQYRVTEFERDFKLKLAAGKVPALVVIRLPGDHTAESRPGDGYPYRASYVADNDLALGKIIAFLSKTTIWRDSALFVTEDDAQNGVDHVDAHRSVLLVASPWVKPGSVSHQHSSMGSIVHAINELLGLPAMNLEDALAGELTGIFDDHPHMEAFVPVPADPRVFVPTKARFAKPKTKEEAAELRDVDDADEIRKEMERSKGKLRKPDSRD